MSGVEQAVRVHLHTVELEHGQHQAFYAQYLGELSLSTIDWDQPFQKPHTGGDVRYETVNDIPNLAWVELDNNRPLSQPAAADETFLVTSTKPYEFTVAADVLKQREVPAYATQWLRMLMKADRPSPPNPRAQTRVLREIAALLPPLDDAEYRAIAVAAMPHLAEYYKRWDQGIAPNDTSYTSITSDILSRQNAADSGKLWLELGATSKEEGFITLRTQSERRLKTILPAPQNINHTPLGPDERNILEERWRLREQARQEAIRALNQ